MRFWVSTVSHDHVQKCAAGGFAEDQPSRLKRVARGDRIVFYSPRPEQRFTAIAEVSDDAPYASEETWRRGASFSECQSAAIQPLIGDLDFIRDKKSWGVFFRRGFFEIAEGDFRSIEQAMRFAMPVTTEGSDPR